MKLSYKQTLKKKILSTCNHNIFINVLKVIFFFFSLEQSWSLNIHGVVLETQTNQWVINVHVAWVKVWRVLEIPLRAKLLVSSVIWTHWIKLWLKGTGFNGSHWFTVCVSGNSCCTCIKQGMFLIFLPSRSNSSSCFDEQHACAAGAGRRCRLSITEVCCSLSVCLPQFPRVHLGEVQTNLFNLH